MPSSCSTSTRWSSRARSGTVAVIEEHAESGGRLEIVSLLDQFRCGGSTAYENWVLRLLEPGRGGPAVAATTISTSAGRVPGAARTVAPAPGVEAPTARISAGYCWPWSDPRRTAPWWTMSSRRLGQAVERKTEGRVKRAGPTSGPPIREGSARSVASTPRRASNTTGGRHHGSGHGARDGHW